MLGKYSMQLPFTKQKGTGTCNLGPDAHWRKFAVKSGGDQWRRQDLVSGGHDNQGASIEVPKAPCGLGYGEGCLLSSRLSIWWSVVSSPSGVRAEPRPLSHFLHILGHRTLLIARKIRFLQLQRCA